MCLNLPCMDLYALATKAKSFSPFFFQYLATILASMGVLSGEQTSDRTLNLLHVGSYA